MRVGGMLRTLFEVGNKAIVSARSAVAPAHIVHVCNNSGCREVDGRWLHSPTNQYQVGRVRAHDVAEDVRILPGDFFRQ